MKITRIESANFIGTARVEVDTVHPVTVFAGPNGSGKTSIADAIACAFTGQPRRVKLKKEFGALLRDGAPKGRVTVSFDDGQGEGVKTAEFRLPKGEQSCDKVTGGAFLPYVLDAHHFASLNEDDRRTMLFELTGCKASGKVVMEKLIGTFGISEQMAQDFAPMLKGGFVSGAKAAADNARDAKEAWRTVTGEAWGKEKAIGWKPAKPDKACPSPEEMTDRLRAHEKLQQDIENGRNYIAAQSALLGASESHGERLTKAREVAGLLTRRKTKLKVTEDDLKAWRDKLPALEQKLSEVRAGTAPIKCPCCDAELRLVDGVLEKFAGLKADAAASSAAALEVSNAREAIKKLDGVRTNDLRDVAESEAAIKQAEAIAAEDTAKVDTGKLQTAKESVEKLVALEKNARAEFNEMQELRNRYNSLEEVERKAAAEHANVTEWLKMADALSPDGIPAQLLADAMAPVDQSLGVLSGICGWEKVVIQDDMSITYGPRPYGLRSESEQWRADALIALAIAQISGLRTVLLDRFDVLDSKGRSRLMGMLLRLGELGAMESMIICGTLKEPMKPSSEYAALWIENSLVEHKA